MMQRMDLDLGVSLEKKSAESIHQLYRPKDDSLVVEAMQFLEGQDSLTEQMIIDFCLGHIVARPNPRQEQLKLFHNRRREILELRKKLHEGNARLDDDGRIVPISFGQPPAVALPPPPGPPALAQLGQNNNNNEHHIEDFEDADSQWIAQQEQQAAEAIARAVRRYKEAGIPQENLSLIRVRPNGGEDAAGAFTFRRICIAVSGIVMAFLLIMLHTLPIGAQLFYSGSRGGLSKTSSSIATLRKQADTRFLHELLNIRRDFLTHAQVCPNLHRNETHLTWYDRLWNVSPLMRQHDAEEDCSSGVLFVPTHTDIVAALKNENSSKQDLLNLTNIDDSGAVNVIWFCDRSSPVTQEDEIANARSNSSLQKVCTAQENQSTRSTPRRCFRGIHDYAISATDAIQALNFGRDLIMLNGADHFDIHYSVDLIQEELPTVLKKVASILQDEYRVGAEVRPVAYRVNAAASMDGTGVSASYSDYHKNHRLLGLLNLTNYIEYMEEVRLNEMPFRLPWPFGTEPQRDACTLMADEYADPRFAIHTSIFLTEGGGVDHRGGASLYVDDHPSNSNSRIKVQRGVAIDASPGRLVVSTGGLENQRCRLPVTAGIRAALQIWWDYA